MEGRQECRHSLWGGRWWRGVAALGAAVGFFAVAGWEFFEEEAAALGDVFGVARGVGASGVLEAGGVLGGEAVGVEGVGGDDFFVGEALFVGLGLVVLGGDFCEGGNGGAESGGIGGDPGLGLEGSGVFRGCGVGEAGAGDGGGEGFGSGFADLELGAEDGVLAGEGEAGGAACSGGEAFHFAEVCLLLVGEGGEIAGLAALGGTSAGEGGDFRREGGDEGCAEAQGHGGLVGGIGEGLGEEVGGGSEGGEGEVEFTARAHDSFL